MELEPYLHFNGNCEDALSFYKGVFGGETTSINRYESMPAEYAVPPGHAQKIMHANFKSPSLKFMASDGMPGNEVRPGDNVSLSLSTRDVAEAQRVFDALSAGGTVTMPFSDTFWGARFGMVTDRYGIRWMINAEKS